MLKSLAKNEILQRLLSALVGLLLCLQSGLLVQNGHLHFGTVLPITLGILFILYSFIYPYIQSFIQKSVLIKKSWIFIWTLFWVWLISLLAFFAFLQYKTLYKVNIPQVAAILILGGGVKGDQPTATVIKRLDVAAKYMQQYPDVPAIATGGLGFNAQYTEAEVMQNYLNQHYAIAKNRVWQESQSTSTEENFRNSASILKQYKIALSAPILIVSSDYHLPRAQAIARKQGYHNTYLLAAPTPLPTRYNNWLREYFAYCSGWILGEY
jgi:uncharacterized SAM-binding protein YcdF (DUF218 family)